MYLGNQAIKRAISEGKIEITPYDENNVEPASYDLTIASGFLKIKEKNYHQGIFGSYINPAKPVKYYDANYGHEEFNGHIIIQPKEFVLASTRETIRLSNDIAGEVNGKSTIGRTGLFIETAGFVDPGFEGDLTLELFNATEHPIFLEQGTKICQIVFIYVEDCTQGYDGQYLNQKGATGAKGVK